MICDEIGTSPSNAIRMFVSAFNRRGGFPFDPSNPYGFSWGTLAAMDDAVAGIWAAAMLEVKAGYYECPHCKALFVPTMGQYVKGYHTLTRRRLTCPECGKTGMCRHRIVR